MYNTLNNLFLNKKTGLDGFHQKNPTLILHRKNVKEQHVTSDYCHTDVDQHVKNCIEN